MMLYSSPIKTLFHHKLPSLKNARSSMNGNSPRHKKLHDITLPYYTSDFLRNNKSTCILRITLLSLDAGCIQHGCKRFYHFTLGTTIRKNSILEFIFIPSTGTGTVMIY